MSITLNCWEFKRCGRESGGAKADELGVCPSAAETRVDGINSGRNGGRACWALSGTLCGGKVQGVFAQKIGNCRKCEFYTMVQSEEGKNYVFTKDILPNLIA